MLYCFDVPCVILSRIPFFIDHVTWDLIQIKLWDKLLSFSDALNIVWVLIFSFLESFCLIDGPGWLPNSFCLSCLIFCYICWTALSREGSPPKAFLDPKVSTNMPDRVRSYSCSSTLRSLEKCNSCLNLSFLQFCDSLIPPSERTDVLLPEDYISLSRDTDRILGLPDS